MEILSARERLRADADSAGSRKWHRIQPQANSAPTPPKPSQAPSPPAHTPTPPERPLPPPPPSRPRLSPLHKAVCFVVGFVLAIALLIDIAPKPLHKPVNPAVLKPYPTITGAPCGTFGSVKRAVLVNNVAGDMATRSYHITCSDGVNFLYTAP